MDCFFHPDISETCILSELESNHAVRVLRLKKGNEISLIDGKGGIYKGVISDANPQKCIVKIFNFNLKNQSTKPKSAFLHLAVAPTKNFERYEWFLEKATEIGINEITPLICEHSERKIVNKERINKILVSAMKQSLNLFLPNLNQPQSSFEFISSFQSTGNNKILQKFIAHHSKNHLKNLYKKGSNALILIGPEGDFSKSEIELAKENGFMEVSLGNSRLRTETAAVVACHAINMLNE